MGIISLCHALLVFAPLGLQEDNMHDREGAAVAAFHHKFGFTTFLQAQGIEWGLLSGGLSSFRNGSCNGHDGAYQQPNVLREHEEF